MPLLHEDNGRGGGGPNENRRSMCSSPPIPLDYMGIDTSLAEKVVTPAAPNNGMGVSEWPPETPESPEAGETPRPLVPARCFPPPHTRAFASYSESAQPGGGALWDENGHSQDMTDLVAALRTLSLPNSTNAGFSGMSPPPAIPYNNSVEPPWPPEKAHLLQIRDEAQNNSQRRGFCTVVRDGAGGPHLRWSGALPTRPADPGAGLSSKLFLGGIPRDLSETALMYALKNFQPVCVEWPGRESGACPRGFVYVTFESEKRVRALLAACRRDNAAWYYRLNSRKVQVIPWYVSEANWVVGGSARLAARRTVFVGALHGMLTAHALATIMNELFAGVVYAGIDTDKHKYPIGSGRVTFDNVRSYVLAISAAYIEIETDKFTKKVQVNPYLEDSMCSVCNLQQGPYFCRDPTCFGYFCRSCWWCQHRASPHTPLMRSSRQAPAQLPPPLPPPPCAYNGNGTPSPATSGSALSEDTTDMSGSRY